MDEIYLLFVSLGMNLVSVLAVSYWMYYKRYQNNDLFKTMLMFNFFVFVIMALITYIEIAIAIGIGLFFLLGMFRLRSEQIESLTMAYWFGSIVLGMINGVQEVDLFIKLFSNAIIIVAVFLIDHPYFLKGISRMKVTLDEIETDLLTEDKRRTNKLEKKFGIDILRYNILRINCIKDTMDLEIFYLRREDGKDKSS